ncbi:hypothetical protein GCM10027343_37600 [Noviherbaspirillum agri]
MRRIAYALIGVVLLYGAFGFLILPAIVKSQAERLAQEKLQRQLVIGSVDVNPFALTMIVRDVRMMEQKGDVLFAGFETLRLNLSLQSVLQLAPVIQELHLSRPDVRLVRTEPHRYNIDDILARLAAQPPSEEPARFSINNIQVEGGRIQFDDRPAKATHAIDNLQLGVPFISSLPSQVNIFVEPLLSASVNGTPVEFKGKARPFADPKEALLELDLDGFDVTRAVGYLPFKPNFRLPSAQLDLHLSASFLQPQGKAPSVKLSGTAALRGLQVTEPGGKRIMKLAAMTATLRDMDLFGGRYDVARIALDGLEADVARERDGQLNLVRLVAPSAGAPAPTGSGGTDAGGGVKFALGELAVHGANLRYTDMHAARPLQSGARKLDLTLRGLAIDTGKRSVDIAEIASNRAGLQFSQGKAQGNVQDNAQAQPLDQAGTAKEGRNGSAYAVSIGRIAIDNWTARIEDRSQSEPVVTDIAPISLALHKLSTAGAAPATVKLDATVNKSGRLALDGKLGLTPLRTDLALDLKGVDVLPLQPYVTHLINLRLKRASLSGNGRLQLDTGSDGALKGGFTGDVMLGNVATVDKAQEKDFLRWKSLYFGGVDMQLAPFALAIDQVALSDFFARVIIDEAGRFNLQDIARGEDGVSKDKDVPASQAAASKPATTPVRIGKLTLQGGRVRFTDNFIKPNYSATLADFGGVVSNLSSDASTSASLNLHAEVNNAPLAVAGSINPLRGDLFLDVKANVRGMELAPLSGYSGRYVGYGIEKGRLSFEVSYLVDQRKLTAENRLILEQITFGEKIDSPTATKLPVLFAVALLRDRNGVIDINLPITGSLDDPEFSVGGILARVIGNLIAKTVTQPFAVLGSLFASGGAELSTLEFEPGRAAIPPAGEEKLKSLAKALTERPGLTLDIAGRVDPEADRAGLRRLSVERKVRAIKSGDLAARGETPAPGRVVVQPAEYPALLERAYKAEKFPKPRNVLGLPKNLPVEEMERLMIDNAEIDGDDLIALGNQRAQTAKNWLIRNGEVPAERLYILAPRIGAPDGQAGGGKVSRVDFSLR